MLKYIFAYFDKSSTFISGILAIGIYLLFLLSLLFYFNTRQSIKPVHYVKKNENTIRVSLASAPTKEKAKEPSPQVVEPKVLTAPKISKAIAKKKDTAKKIKDTSQKVLKEKIVKKVKPKPKPKEKPKEKPKKVNKPKSLFENIKSDKPKEKPKPKEKVKPKPPKPITKPKKKTASEMLSESMKVQKASDRGKVDIYKASVTEKLQSWPTQSDFAGQTVKIKFVIEKSGRFTFKILKYASNPSFTNALKLYLQQLQGIGLGRHEGSRAFVFDIEFEAIE